MLKSNYSGHLTETGLDEAGRGGFTIHEHYDVFGIINMNGRCYDPWLGRMLSPDNYVQAAGYSQNYNRYSYCINNPLIFTDPTGEKWWHWALADLLTGGALSFTGVAFVTPVIATLNVQTISAMSTTSIITASIDLIQNGKFGKKTENSFKIDLGMMHNLPGWETPQALAGNYISHYRNISGEVTNVENGFGYTLVNGEGGYQGLTLGSYINGWGIDKDYKHDPMFVHEFGHTIQSKFWGPMYLHAIGFPSGISGILDYYTSIDHNHDNTWFEINANQYGQIFFNPRPNKFYPTEESIESDFPKSFSYIDWNWFILFNPFILF